MTDITRIYGRDVTPHSMYHGWQIYASVTRKRRSLDYLWAAVDVNDSGLEVISAITLKQLKKIIRGRVAENDRDRHTIQ